MSQAKKLMDAFCGSIAAHGTTTVGRVGRNGKAEAKSMIVRGPLTDELVQGHIEGRQGVGSIPITQDNLCMFGALDIDTYDLNLVELNAKVQKLGLPLVLCRSKSGGAHLYLFLKQWEQAAMVREYLTEMSVALGFSGCEIFPKQDTILAERGDVGNFINMPYFGGDVTTRYALDEKGEAMDMAQFFAAVDAARIDIPELNELQFGGERTHFTDGPYCLEIITGQGSVTEHRNTFMFNVGVYCRLKWPDDWKKHHEEYNRTLCSPALEATEIVALQKSLMKKEYFLQCSSCPLKDYCDVQICKSRQFGVGNSAPDQAALGGLTVMLSEPRHYFMDVDGQRLQLTVEQLQNQGLWQRSCMEQLNFMPPQVKPQDWQVAINTLMKNSVTIDVPPELTIKGQFHEMLKTFCTSRIRALSPEEMEMGKPWTEEGVTYFTMAGLEQFLKNRQFTHYKAVHIQEQLKTLNDGGECYLKKNIKKDDGSRKQLRVWHVPAFEDEEIELEPKEFSDDIPF
jgi:hypothetical protein